MKWIIADKKILLSESQCNLTCFAGVFTSILHNPEIFETMEEKAGGRIIYVNLHNLFYQHSIN